MCELLGYMKSGCTESHLCLPGIHHHLLGNLSFFKKREPLLLGSHDCYQHGRSLAEPRFLLIKFTVGDSYHVSMGNGSENLDDAPNCFW